jgi:CheY-like chemotaxis protein
LLPLARICIKPGAHRNQTTPSHVDGEQEAGGVAMARLIVVEDEPQVLVLADSILSDAGHETKTAANASQALALLRTDEHFDVLFTDINLGDNSPNGLSLASEAVQMRNSLKVIYATGETLTDGMKALFVPGSLFLGKPYVPDDLLHAVEELTSGGDGRPSG